MDARDKLRLYLEQRRDLGESELLLDSLTVDDALKAIGALNQRRPVPQGLRERSPQERPVPERPVQPAQRPPSNDIDQSDWRAVLADTAKPSESVKEGEPARAIVAESSADELFNADILGHGSLESIATAVESCTRCALYKTATRGVAGQGSATAGLVCVGEAPGANEDETGLPFVGAAGQLLTKILAAVELTREEVFISNVVKHRPPGNRNPTPEEIAACSPYLVRQLELIKPKVILALGTFAAQTLLNTRTPIGKLRGEIHSYHGIPVVVTYHPAALLRNPAWKRPTWEDVKLARRILDGATGA